MAITATIYDGATLRAAYSQVYTKAKNLKETLSTKDTYNKLQQESIKVIHHCGVTDIDSTTAKIINWYAAKLERFEVFFQDLPQQLEMDHTRFSQAPRLDEKKQHPTPSLQEENNNELSYVSLALLGVASAIFHS